MTVKGQKGNIPYSVISIIATHYCCYTVKRNSDHKEGKGGILKTWSYKFVPLSKLELSLFCFSSSGHEVKSCTPTYTHQWCATTTQSNGPSTHNLTCGKSWVKMIFLLVSWLPLVICCSNWSKQKERSRGRLQGCSKLRASAKWGTGNNEFWEDEEELQKDG